MGLAPRYASLPSKPWSATLCCCPRSHHGAFHTLHSSEPRFITRFANKCTSSMLYVFKCGLKPPSLWIAPSTDHPSAKKWLTRDLAPIVTNHCNIKGKHLQTGTQHSLCTEGKTPNVKYISGFKGGSFSHQAIPPMQGLHQTKWETTHLKSWLTLSAF